MSDVDDYIARSDKWPEEISALRPVLLGAGLTEELKWRQPCYSHDGHNIVILQEMNDHLSVMFFKGALLADPEGVLHDQGPSSRSAKRIRITSVDEAESLTDVIRAYVQEAIDVEEAGIEVPPAPEPERCEELAARLAADDELREAFEALTPGRQRSYDLHIGGAKKAETRERRIDQARPRILAGKGMNER